MLYLYLDPIDSCYVLCNPDTYQVGIWTQYLDEAIKSYFYNEEPDNSHTTFSKHYNVYTLIATYPSYSYLANFQANHPELFI